MTGSSGLSNESSPPTENQILPANVAIAHDYLNQRGGAERVVLEMAEIWPEAPIYTSLYRAESTFPEFRKHDIRRSFLDRLPVDRGFRTLLPLYPLAFSSFGKLDADLVVSSSSGWAHMVRTTAASFHVVYCYTPARWLYGGEHLDASRGHQAVRPVIGVLRALDRRAAHRADLYIAISEAVRLRIRQRYGIEAPVVYPPVDVDRFSRALEAIGCSSFLGCFRTSGSTWSSMPLRGPESVLTWSGRAGAG